RFFDTGMNMLTPLALGMPQGFEWLLIAGVALLIWGKRLPEVARNMGRGVVEFKKGLKGIEDEMDTQANQPTLPPKQQTPQVPPPQYKFDPYTGKPLDPNATPTGVGKDEHQ